jgi:tRNA A-37 threonylcarbamoyl transferase component Bud32
MTIKTLMTFRTSVSIYRRSDRLHLPHDTGLVHGDIQTTNIMVQKNGGQGVMLVDFDWAGRLGEV